MTGGIDPAVHPADTASVHRCRCMNSLLTATPPSSVMNVITKTRCSAANPSSNLISALSIEKNVGGHGGQVHLPACSPF